MRRRSIAADGGDEVDGEVAANGGVRLVESVDVRLYFIDEFGNGGSLEFVAGIIVGSVSCALRLCE